MENYETARQTAKAKVKLLAFFVFGAVVCGGVWEYQRSTAALDSSTIVILGQEAGKAAENAAALNVKSDAESGSETLSDGVVKTADEDVNKAAFAEFWAYLNEIQVRSEEVYKRESVLAKIKEAAPVEEKKAEELFDDDVIEIYDSQKGVVSVIEADVSEAPSEVENLEPDVESDKEAQEAVGKEVESFEVNETAEEGDEGKAENMSENLESGSTAENSDSGVLEADSVESFENGEGIENISKNEENIENDGAIDLLKGIANHAEG